MKRRDLMMLIAGLAIALPLASYAQQSQQPLKRIDPTTYDATLRKVSDDAKKSREYLKK